MSELQNGVEKEGITSLTVEGTVETEGKYTRIRVNAQDEAGSQLLYAIDSQAPEAFSESNEFTVEKGSKHIIYVKDSAGNISSQVYQVSEEQIEMIVDASSARDTSSYRTEIPVIEDGGGSALERVKTDNTNDAERVFYTVKTKDDHVFYLVIDQSRENNNVYLLNQVDTEDLYAFTGAEAEQEQPNENIFSTQNTETQVQKEEPVNEKKNSGDGWFLFLVLGLLGAAAFYYYKIYKPKQQKMSETDDAKDLDDFEPDEDDDVLDFTVSKEEKEELMNLILNSNDLDEELPDSMLPDSMPEEVYKEETEEVAVPEETDTEEDTLLELPEDEF